MTEPRRACMDCGGPKPAGRGRLYCEACVAKRRSCIVCGERAPSDRRTCSDECLREHHIAIGYKLQAREAVKPPKPLAAERPERTCARCKRTFPQTLEFFTSMRRDNETGKILRYHAWCRECHRNYERQRWASRSPEQIEANRRYAREAYEHRRDHDPEFHAKMRANRRAWRAANPEREAEQQKRWAERVKADPERHARYLEMRRIYYRLKREQETGELPVGRHSTATRAYRYRHMPKPLEPFALWLDEVLTVDKREIEEIAAHLEIPERRLYDYRERIPDRVALPVAERAIERYGPVRIQPQRLEESPGVAAELARLEDHWRNAPGNGTRLTGYLASVESLMRLAGAVIVTAEDLWPS